MKASKTGLGLLAAMIAIFALPAAAQAEYLVPPGNSAATQYTEAVPTAGGPKATNRPAHAGGRSPRQVLGNRNAEKLDARGPAGHAAAEVAAATAPSAISVEGEGASPAAGHSSSGDPASGIGSGGSGSNGGAAGNGGSGARPGGAADRHATLASQRIPSGSSGLGEVLGQATGSSSSGQLGLLLPLIVLGTIAWSVAFVLRQRRRPTH